MNIKKGLIRLFIVCSIISSIGGFFYLSSESKSQTSMQIETIWAIEKNLKDPVCSEIVRKNPNEFPVLVPSYACSPLSIYWQSIKQYQNKNISKYPQFNEKLVNDAMWSEIRSQQIETGIFGLLLGFIWNLIIWIFMLIVFFTIRWVKKGFFN